MKFQKILESIPKTNIAGFWIEEKKYEINIRDFVKYLTNFPIAQIDVSMLSHIKTWDDFENITIIKNGREIKFNELDKKNQDKHKKIIEKSIMKTNVKYPIIILVNNEKIDSILDGNHRVQKAKILGIKSLPAYILNNNDIEKYLSTKSLETIK